MFSFGTQLKTLRKQYKVTQKQVAEKINITERNYQAYEANTQKPTYDNLIALADFFNVSLDFLVGRTNNPEVNK